MNVGNRERVRFLPQRLQRLAQDVHPERAERELQLVEHLRASWTTGLRLADPDRLIYLYVTLKSRPIAVIYGEAGGGKLAAASRLIDLLNGMDGVSTQYLIGHAWWAADGHNMGVLAESQRRFNIETLEALLSEALLPSNRRTLYIACLRQISPAEWMGLLTPLAYQWKKGYVIRLDSLHFARPRPFPRNFLSLATMNRTRLPVPDARSLAGLTALRWESSWAETVEEGTRERPDTEGARPYGPLLLQEGIHSKEAVLRRLCLVPGSQRRALNTLFSIMETLDWLPTPLRDVLLTNALLDLANSLTADGRGLFDPDPQVNSLVCLDLIFSLSLLPTVHQSTSTSSSPRWDRVMDNLQAGLPRSRRYLDSIA